MKKIFFILSFIFTILLFALLYFIGIMNLFFTRSFFFEKYKFLYFGKPVFSFFYLIILSIFFIVMLSIMIKIIATETHNQKKPVLDEPLPLKQLSQPGEKTENADHQKEKNEPVKKIEDMNYQEKIDKAYFSFSQMTTDLFEAASIVELFEKTLFWSLSFSHSNKGSIMLFNQNKELGIYNSSGWSQDEMLKLKKLNDEHFELAKKVIDSKKKLFIDDIRYFEGHDFKHSQQYDTFTLALFPIICFNKVIGILNLTDPKHEYYTTGDLEAVNVIVKNASSALELLKLKKRESLDSLF